MDSNLTCLCRPEPFAHPAALKRHQKSCFAALELDKAKIKAAQAALSSKPRDRSRRFLTDTYSSHPSVTNVNLLQALYFLYAF
jgi:hypothetical protein